MLRLVPLAFPLFLCSLLVTPGLAAEITSGLQAKIAAARPGETLPVIVTFAAEPDLRPFRAGPKKERRTAVGKALRETAESSQRGVKNFLRGKGKKFDELWIVNGLALQATPDLIETLAAQPEVAQIASDQVVPPPELTPSPLALPWNMAAVHAEELWAAGVTGQGITVGIIDTGVNASEPALASAYRGGDDSWFDPYGKSTAPYDPNGHGTAVAGVAVGAGGVARGAQWIAAKIFPDEGQAFSSQIILSLQWVLDPDNDGDGSDSPDIINNSWGFDSGACLEGKNATGDSVRKAVQALKAAGIAVVASAGNAGPGGATGTSPGNYPESFAVGSINQQSLISGFSSRGPSACYALPVFPAVVAPGESITTLKWIYSGTSFSAPHVSGVMALLLSEDPSLTPGELEAALKNSATDLGAAGPDNNYGYGAVNALAAYNLLAGHPQLAVHDPAPPENDLRLDFGQVPPGGSAEQRITLRNSGDGLLHLFGIGTASPFSLGEDTCSNRSLLADQSCSVTVRFTPRSLTRAGEPFTGALEIRSNDPDPERKTLRVELSGSGNTLPPKAILATPVDGAITPPVPVLQWTQAADADGDPITHSVAVSTDPDFQDAVWQVVGADPATLLAGAGSLFFGLAAALGRRRRTAVFLSLVAFLALLVACGSGGGGSSSSPQVSEEESPLAAKVLSFRAEGLQEGEKYYWKVISEDSRGGRSESATWSFTPSSPGV